MSIPYNSIINRNGCCNQRPDTIAVSFTESSNTTGGTFTSSTATTTTINNAIDIGDILNVDILNASSIDTTSLSANSISTFSINVENLSSFSTGLNDDVIFFGNNINNKLFWDSSENTLFIDGEFKTSDNNIYLNYNSSGDPLLSSNNEDKGFFFKWYDTSEKIGFLGFDVSTKKFTLMDDVIETNGEITSGNLGTLKINKLEVNEITNIDTTDTLINISNADLFTTITNGSYDLQVSGDILNIENTDNTISLISSKTGINAISLLTDNSGNIDIETQNGGDILITSSNDITNQIGISNSFTIDATNTLTFNNNNGLTVSDAKTDYKLWINYQKFDIGTTGYWESKTGTSSGIKYNYWEKEPNLEVSELNIDLTTEIRSASNKGYKLTSIYVNYDIETDDINNIDIQLNKRTLSTSNPPVYSNIPYTNTGLLSPSAFLIGEHYKKIDITTPTFINDDSIINLYISFDTKELSLLKFYGIMIYFDYNHL